MGYPQKIHFYGIFHSKATIFEYLHLWKPPYGKTISGKIECCDKPLDLATSQEAEEWAPEFPQLKGEASFQVDLAPANPMAQVTVIKWGEQTPKSSCFCSMK